MGKLKTMSEKLHLLENQHRFTQEYCSTQEGLIDLICRDCDFYREDDEQLECFAFKILKNLLQKHIITPEQIIDAFR